MPYKIVIEAQGNKGGKTYLGDIVVTLDKETIPVQVELRTKPEPDQHERIRNGFKEFWGSDEIIAKNIFIKNIYWLIMIFILLFIDYPLLYSIIFEENIIKRIFLIPFLLFFGLLLVLVVVYYICGIYMLIEKIIKA